MAYRTQKEKQLADSLTQETQRQATAQTMAEEELFSFAEYDPGKAEKTGYSDYSYWKSTFAVFLRNKTAGNSVTLFLHTRQVGPKRRITASIFPAKPLRRQFTVSHGQYGTPRRVPR